MELNKEQIAFIDKYLKEKGINYWDIRLEMVDHIVNDIEAMTNLQNNDFETVFNQSIEKWQDLMKPTSSWILTLGSRPKIVVQKAKKLYFKWFLLSTVFSLLPLILRIEYFNSWEAFITDHDVFVRNAMVILSFSNCAAMITIYFKLKKINIESTFSFLFKYRAFPILTSTPLLFVLIFFSHDIANFFPSILILTNILFIYTLFGYKMLQKHKEVSEKYSSLRCN